MDEKLVTEIKQYFEREGIYLSFESSSEVKELNGNGLGTVLLVEYEGKKTEVVVYYFITNVRQGNKAVDMAVCYDEDLLPYYVIIGSDMNNLFECDFSLN